MEIVEIKNSKLNEVYFDIKNEYNLKILLYPMPKFSSSLAVFATHFGSVNTIFKQKNDKEYTKVVDGVAHFLEHQLFENEDKKKHAFNLFAKTGALANALTSFNVTAYLFQCSNNFNESLKILLQFVQSPQFVPENIIKERGIIEQEIQMYEDDPESKVMFNCLKCLYQKHPIRINLGGSIESIAKIDVDVLNKCYNTFYRLNNMGLVVAGNFEVDSCIETIEKNLKNFSNNEPIETKSENEPYEILQKTIEIEMPVLIPQFCIGYKLKPTTKQEFFKQNLIFNIICEMLVGEGSKLYDILYNKNLVISGIVSHEILIGEGYFTIIFSGQSTNYNEVYRLLNDEIESIKQNGFDEDFFNLIKRSAYGHQILNFNSVKTVAESLLDAFIYDYNMFDSLKVLSDLTIESVNREILKIDTQNSVLSAAYAKQR